jgi:hypothetical protein
MISVFVVFVVFDAPFLALYGGGSKRNITRDIRDNGPVYLSALNQPAARK